MPKEHNASTSQWLQKSEEILLNLEEKILPEDLSYDSPLLEEYESGRNEVLSLLAEARSQIIELLMMHQESLPTDMVEMGHLYAQMTPYIDPLIEELNSLRGVKGIKRKPLNFALSKHIRGARKGIQLTITHHQKKETKKWKNLNWETPQDAKENVKRVVAAHLGIPEIAPERQSEKWHLYREKIKNSISQTEFEDWLLQRAYVKSEFFPSYKDALVAAFGKDYDLKKEDFDRKNPAETKGIVHQRVREKVSKMLPLPLEAPSEESDEFRDIQQQLSSLSALELRDWELGREFRNQWYESHIPLIIESFPEYHLDESMFLTRDYSWETKEIAQQNVAPILIERIGIPQPFPEKHSREWHQWRWKIVDVVSSEYIDDNGIGASFGKQNSPYRSHIDLVVDVDKNCWNGGFALKRYMFLQRGKFIKDLPIKKPHPMLVALFKAYQSEDEDALNAANAQVFSYLQQQTRFKTTALPLREFHMLVFDHISSILREMQEDCTYLGLSGLKKLWERSCKLIKMRIYTKEVEQHSGVDLLEKYKNKKLTYMLPTSSGNIGKANTAFITEIEDTDSFINITISDFTTHKEKNIRVKKPCTINEIEEFLFVYSENERLAVVAKIGDIQNVPPLFPNAELDHKLRGKRVQVTLPQDNKSFCGFIQWISPKDEDAKIEILLKTRLHSNGREITINHPLSFPRASGVIQKENGHTVVSAKGDILAEIVFLEEFI